MSTIRVDPDTLRKAADEIVRISEQLRAAGNQVQQTTRGAPGYDGQFGPHVASMGSEALARVRMVADRLAERSAWLAAKAEAFEAADLAALQGLDSVRWELLAWVHGQDGGLLEGLLEDLSAPPPAPDLEGLITRPAFLVFRQRPPWISREAWNHMDREDRAEVLSEAKASLERFWRFYRDHLAAGIFPDVLVVFAGAMNIRAEPNVGAKKVDALGGIENSGRAAWDGQVRWDEEGRLWFHVSGDNVASGWVAAWQGGEKPHMNLVAHSPFEDGGPWTPQVETSGYDQKGGWDLYQSGSAPQYLNVREIMHMAGVEGWQTYPDQHHNLCGELAVYQALGMPLEEGFRAFAATGSGQRILHDPRQGTGPPELSSIFDDAGWTSGRSTPDFDAFVGKPFSPTGANIALITIDPETGRPEATDLAKLGAGLQADHWVDVLGVTDSSMTVYNPFTNRQESYNLTEMELAWRSLVITAAP